MERPTAPKQGPRDITGEIVYLDYLRRTGQKPQQFSGLHARDQVSFEIEAGDYRIRGERPTIMGEYEAVDAKSDELCREATALADVLLEHRDPDSRVTFVDFVVDGANAATEMVANSSIGQRLLAKPDDQLAIPSNGEHYPSLDIRRRDLASEGIFVRAWGWNYPRGAYVPPEGIDYKYPEHYLAFPESEINKARQLDIHFLYTHPTAGIVSENLTLYVSGNAYGRLSSRYFANAYAETGYEGHGGKEIEPTDESIVEFLELVARLVGDAPESVDEMYERKLTELVEVTKGESCDAQIVRLIDVSWPAQTMYELYECRYDELQGNSIVEALTEGGELGKQALGLLDDRIQYYDDFHAHRYDDPDGLDPMLWG